MRRCAIQIHVLAYFTILTSVRHRHVAGFLTSGGAESTTRGNYALYDLLAALEWIAENVRSFGGDKQLVTLMGHGHGAALVHLLAISPLTAG